MAEAIRADAPGRVNLIGEHTDYHEGFVLPVAIPQRTHVLIQPRDERYVRARSTALSHEWVQYEVGRETPGRSWLDYVQGVTATLARAGYDVPGFDLHIDSTIPVGAGLSSSAALEVSLLRGLRILLNLPVDDIELARLAQAAETGFVGAPVGIMDHVACSVGREGEALFLDTRTLMIERLPLPHSIEILVIDSGISHALAGGEYAVRRRESFEAATLLGVERLRDVDEATRERVENLPPLLARRARHVITENGRVLAAVAALREGDAPAIGSLLNASHRSMRDDYEVSTPDVDALVAIGQRHPDIYGARLTGGGFGGAVVLVAKAGTGRTAAEEITHTYRQQTGRPGAVLVPAP